MYGTGCTLDYKIRTEYYTPNGSIYYNPNNKILLFVSKYVVSNVPSDRKEELYEKCAEITKAIESLKIVK
jgi:hypothetical protein